MPNPGFIHRLIDLYDTIPTIGTMIYEGTLVSVKPGFGGGGATIIGGVVLRTNKLSNLEFAGFEGVAEDIASIIGGRVFAFGRGMGTLIGTGVGTLVADSNTLLIQLWTGTFGGTVVGSPVFPGQPAAGTTIRGTILVELFGT